MAAFLAICKLYWRTPVFRMQLSKKKLLLLYRIILPRHLSSRETALNCKCYNHLQKGFHIVLQYKFSVSCNEFSFIHIQSSSWPATVESVTMFYFSILFRIGTNSTDSYPYYIYIYFKNVPFMVTKQQTF